MICIEISSLQKLLRKALLYRLMININGIISESGLSHQEISCQTGRARNWFNDAYNNNEDIRLSSLSKVFAVLSKEFDLSNYQITDLFDKKVLHISGVLNSLADEDNDSIAGFILSEREIFSDLIADWGSLNEKKKLNEDEQFHYSELKFLLSE